MPTPPPKPIEAYLAKVPEPTQTTLRHLREIILAAVPPHTTEVISYGFPAFALPRPFIGYCAFKRHIALLPFSGSFYDDFAEDLAPYTRTKSSLHLPLNQPLPTTLIQKLVRTRLATL
jgi:uncharacterized protein YdhG (YjbR/CyaY superfamily)